MTPTRESPPIKIGGHLGAGASRRKLPSWGPMTPSTHTGLGRDGKKQNGEDAEAAERHERDYADAKSSLEVGQREDYSASPESLSPLCRSRQGGAVA
jgi:hypothetical protein